MAKSVLIKDTTLRDGEQCPGGRFTPEQKLQLAIALLQVGVDRLEVASATVRGDEASFARIAAWANANGQIGRIECLGFINESSIDWIVKHGGAGCVVNLLGKGSRRHCVEQLGREPQAHWGDLCRVATYAREHGLRPQLYLEDWSQGMLATVAGEKGRPVPDPYVRELVAFLAGEHPSFVERLILCDTLGVLWPSQVFDFVRCVRRWTRQSLPLSFHGHNDFGLATANCLAAVRAGADTVDVTVNGLGERAGNACLHEVVEVLRLWGRDVSIPSSELRELSEMVAVFSRRRLPPNAPIVGRDVFYNTAGIHADGDAKGNLYVPAARRPEAYGAHLTHTLGKLSGKASVRSNCRQLGLQLDDAQITELHRRVLALSESKSWVTVGDLQLLAAELLGRPDLAIFEVMLETARAGWEGATGASFFTGQVRFRATVHTVSGSGDGEFNAFIQAVSALQATQSLRLPILVDYEVVIPPTPSSPADSSAALTEAVITWEHPETSQRFITAGLDTNQVRAAIKAAAQAISLANLQNGHR